MTASESSVRHIQLSQGKVAVVDAADYEWLNQWKWSASRSTNGRWCALRVVQENNVQTCILMHRLIMDAPDGVEVDHEDRDGLHNCRSNLRLASRAQNSRNSGLMKRNKSGYKGVCFFKRWPSWLAYITVNRKRIHLGYHATPESAAKAYDDAARQYFGKFARLNFPAEQERGVSA